MLESQQVLHVLALIGDKDSSVSDQLARDR